VSERIQATSTAVTNGVRVIVSCSYVPEQSLPAAHRFAFAYSVRIVNEGRQTVQLLNRHWIITDFTGKVQDVRGVGVVGEQPILRQGESFEYKSGAVLTTARGNMRGSYEMRDLRGHSFDVAVAPFLLALPYSLH
jgi:ApaG protein